MTFPSTENFNFALLNSPKIDFSINFGAEAYHAEELEEAGRPKWVHCVPTIFNPLLVCAIIYFIFFHPKPTFMISGRNVVKGLKCNVNCLLS